MSIDQLTIKLERIQTLAEILFYFTADNPQAQIIAEIISETATL